MNIVSLLSRVFRALPLPLALALGRAIALAGYYLLPIRRGVARKNVRRALGKELSPAQRRRVVRGCYAQLGMYGAEVLRLPLLTPELSARLVRVVNNDGMYGLIGRGKGVIAVVAHIGNFELMAASQAIRGLPLAAVAKDIAWRPAQAFADQIRARANIRILPPRRSKDEIRASLGRGEVVAFAIDQHMAPHRAIVCEFFGQLASTSPAPVRFALETGAPIQPAVMYREGNSGHHVLTYEPEFRLELPYADRDANIRHNTERLNRLIEGWIRRDPEQWLWLHKRWKVHDAPAGWDIPPELEHLREARP